MTEIARPTLVTERTNVRLPACFAAFPGADVADVVLRAAMRAGGGADRRADPNADGGSDASADETAVAR